MDLLFIGPRYAEKYIISLARTTTDRWPEIINKMYGEDISAIIEKHRSYGENVYGLVLVTHDQLHVFSPKGSIEEYHKNYWDCISKAHEEKIKVAAVLRNNSLLPGNNYGLDLVVASEIDRVRIDLDTQAKELWSYFWDRIISTAG